MPVLAAGDVSGMSGRREELPAVLAEAERGVPSLNSWVRLSFRVALARSRARAHPAGGY